MPLNLVQLGNDSAAFAGFVEAVSEKKEKDRAELGELVEFMRTVSIASDDKGNVEIGATSPKYVLPVSVTQSDFLALHKQGERMARLPARTVFMAKASAKLAKVRKLLEEDTDGTRSVMAGKLLHNPADGTYALPFIVYRKA